MEYLHTMIRVTDLDKSLDCFCNKLGLVETRRAVQALRTDTFNSGTGTLTQVYLTQKAVLGSVYVSFYNGTTYNNAGIVTGGPANPLPAITYDEAYNAVVFGSPVPAGSTQARFRPSSRQNESSEAS